MLIQLAGHLRGRALQEWGLLSAHERESLEEATTILHNRLDPCSRALAAQDFRHASQREEESIADFIRRLEQLFKLAYGRYGMSEETRGTLLHGQLQEGLRYEIMRAPAVSGSHGYKELCLASRNEEKRLVELKRRQYWKPLQRSTFRRMDDDQMSQDRTPWLSQDMANNPAERRERALLVPVGKRDSEMQTVGAVAPDITTQALSRDVVVPMVRISLVTSLQVPSYQSVLAEVRTDLPYVDTDPLLLQYRQDAKESLGVQAEDVLIHLSQDQPGKVLLSNATGFTQHLEAGEFLGEAAPVVIVSPPDPEIVRAFTVTTSQDDATDCREKRRRQTLKKSLEEPDLPPQEKQALLEFLTKYHHAFSLEDGERGEIDLIYMEINTGEARPKKQRVRRVRRVPFALRQVVSGQLAKMQRDGVIQPSRSPWSSPVVLVKKRDGTHRFCIDYRALNSRHET